jgi:hypothetical protein
MLPFERRYAPRVRVELFLTEYVHDEPVRALATNISHSGLLVQTLVERTVAPPPRVVAVEFEIPGSGETVWARAEPRFDVFGDDFRISGLTFTGMAGKHARLLREFVLDKKLSQLWRAPLGRPSCASPTIRTPVQADHI